MKTPEEIFDAIRRERDYQDAKWGSLSEHQHTIGEWLLILEAGLQQAKQEWGKGRHDNLLRELIQITTVGVACLEQHGIAERIR